MLLLTTVLLPLINIGLQSLTFEPRGLDTSFGKIGSQLFYQDYHQIS